MFTGIVEAIGRVVAARDAQADRTLVIEHDGIAARLNVGASVALDGVCQTVTALSDGCFSVHAIAETLRATTLGRLRPGAGVNLELPLSATSPVGGHFVSGHVDGVATLASLQRQGDSVRMEIAAEGALLAQLVPKGSVAVDGVSLTVGPRVTGDRFEVFLIPHTLSVTTLGARAIGDGLNIETDLLGKYVLRFLGRLGEPPITWESLRAAGFAAPGEGGGA